ALANRGDSYSSRGEFGRAIEDYDQAILIDPTFAYAYNGRGNAYRAQSQYDRAIEDFDQAIRLDPSEADVFYNRGRAFHAKNRYDRAIEDYDQAIRLAPNDAKTLYSRAGARLILGQFAAASADYMKRLSLDEPDPYPTLFLYISQARSGVDGRSELAVNAAKLDLSKWPGAAIKLFLGQSSPEAVLSARPNSGFTKAEWECEAYFYLAEFELLRGSKAKAVELFRKSVATGVSRFSEFQFAEAELARLEAK
ncbi:MAG: tetratricopeptide repeat protein, partial [Proteobacteria bacterium]|nr:tetratricopeptide repeat protein [Pseudomonadota bacterium]